jgi:hypothetical protein
MRPLPDLSNRSMEDWPEFGEEWGAVADLLGATILTESGRRVEEEHTNDALACQLAIASIRSYVEAAAVQIKRIDEDYSSITSGGETDYAAHRLASIDIHFYFLIWSRVEEMIRLIEVRSGFGVTLPEKDRQSLKRYKEARHHMEHYAERLPGGERMRPGVTGPGGVSIDPPRGRFWFYDDESWEIGDASLEELRRIAFEFETAVLRAAKAKFDDEPSR